MNCSCNMGVTQPIGIFLPAPSRESTTLCGFGVLSSLFVMVHAMDLLTSPHHPPFLLPPSVFPIIVWTGGLLAPDVRRSIYLPTPYSQPYSLPIPTIVSPSLST